MIRVLSSVGRVLDKLDPNRYTRVNTDSRTGIIELSQIQGVKIVISNLQGLVELPKGHRISILTPIDLDYLVTAISDLVASHNENNEPFLVAPHKFGFDIYGKNDIYVSTKPRLLHKLRFMSVSNRLLLFILKHRNPEVDALLRK